MALWPSFVALLVLAIVGTALAQDNSAVMMPGVNSRSSSIGMSGKRRRPMRVTVRPDSERRFNSDPDSLTAPIHFPTITRGPPIDRVPSGDGRAGQPNERPPMDLMDAMDVDKLDYGNLRMLNSIATMEEFAAMFNIEIPESSNNRHNAGIAARFGPSEGTAVELPQAVCLPEEHTVELDLPSELNVVYLPKCVRLKRCGGCCLGSMLECRPTQTEAINIKVMRIASSAMTRTRSSGPDTGRQRPDSSGRAASTRRRRRNIAEMITVAEEQHTACECQCRVQEQDCNPALQEYLPDICRCQCRNTDEEDKCDTQRMTHYWDEDQCTCFCLKTVNCSVTLRFDHTTCSCVQIPHELPFGRSGLAPRAGFVGGNNLDESNERFRRDRFPVVFNQRDGRQARDVDDADNR